MPLTCSICGNKRLSNINHELLKGTPLRHIAAQWHVTTSSLQRHKHKCLVEQLRRHEIVSEERLLEELTLLVNETRSALQDAKLAKSLAGRAALLAQLQRNCDLLARLSADLQPPAANEPIRIELCYGDRKFDDGPAFQVERQPELPAVPAEVVKEEAPTITSEIIRPALPAPRHTSLLSVAHRSVFGPDFAKRVL